MAQSLRTKVYNPDEIAIQFAGFQIDGGYADGSFCSIEFQDSFTMQKGTDGEVTRSRTNDRSAVVTIKLMQTSSANQVLSAYLKADLNAPNGQGIADIQIKDLVSGSLYTSNDCWIQKHADVDFDRDATSREWVFQCGHMDAFTSGS